MFNSVYQRKVYWVACFLAIVILGLFIIPNAFSKPQQSKLKLLIKNAWLVPLDGSGEVYKNGYFSVDDDGKIVDLAAGDPPADLDVERIYDAQGKIVMPGFLSGHSHLIQSPFRGIASDQNLLGWMWGFHRTYDPFYSADDLYAFALHGGLDHLAHGITTVYDWTSNFNSYPLEEYLQQYKGGIASGIRLMFGFAIDLKQSLDENDILVNQFIEFMTEQQNHPQNMGNAMAGLGTLIGTELATMELTLANKYHLPIQVHYLEDPDPQWVQAQQALFPIFKQQNMLGPRLNFAHFIHTNDTILKASAKTGTTMVWNPLSNGRLASGLPDIPKYMEYGIKIGMGVDGEASADLADPFENMRMGAYSIRMQYQKADILSPLDMLRLHTIETAKVLGVDDKVGSLEVGKYADFIVIDPENVETGPIFDVFAHLVFTMSSANIERVYVGGNLLVKEGMPLNHDYVAIKEDVRHRVDSIRKQVKASEGKNQAQTSQQPFFTE